MTNITIYHNPRCSKSRETLRLLQEQGIEADIIEYLKTPPTKTELKKILAALKFQPRELIRTNEKCYKELKLSEPTVTTDQLLDAMVQHPILIQRPIVVFDKKAMIGRPPESILEMFA